MTLEAHLLEKEVPSLGQLHVEAKDLQDYVVDIRRALHEIPEVSWEEEETLKFIKGQIVELIEESPLEFKLVEAQGGIWVDLTISEGVERVLLRADVDALPIHEETNLPFESKNPGVMHACGHDCHSAMLLAAFKAVCEGRIEARHNLRFVWQRAEERSDRSSGGYTLIREGVLKGVSSVHALHIASTMENGVFSSKPGIMMSNSAQIILQLSCSGGHVMSPDLGSNAIDVMTDIQVAMRGFSERFLGGGEPIVFIPSISKAGIAANIRPNRADLTFVIRNYLTTSCLEEFVHAVKERIEQVIACYKSAELESFQFNRGYPAVVNDRSHINKIDHDLQLLGFETKVSPLLFAGEDFSYYLEGRPGTFWMLGAKQGMGYDHHTPKFNPDESVLWKGIAFWMALITL